MGEHRRAGWQRGELRDPWLPPAHWEPWQVRLSSCGESGQGKNAGTCQSLWMQKEWHPPRQLQQWEKRCRDTARNKDAQACVSLGELHLAIRFHWERERGEIQQALMGPATAAAACKETLSTVTTPSLPSTFCYSLCLEQKGKEPHRHIERGREGNSSCLHQGSFSEHSKLHLLGSQAPALQQKSGRRAGILSPFIHAHRGCVLFPQRMKLG